ncbi:DUF934 domain-containing protein [Massilia endophytica]|uniref:DUF934 domain-containing protein n=1 Tax=Massilia endophytica TaxID=2899220 RepID=UPI001E556EAE|nr:DUF934 domain-containing protein [Massilia endophytica]UGQ47704.1 DUF934 domain-containing protein [Massilia endophytica]
MPDQIIKGRSIVRNEWQLLRLAEGQEAASAEVPAGKVIVPLAVWEAQRETLAVRGDIGVWLASDQRPEVLKEDLQRFPVIAVDFPKFTDGRGYSIAFNLRMRLGYKGELRAIGDVLRDQLFQMQRVGFDAYDTRPDRSIEDALKGLTVFSETYQASVDNRIPLFRRHQRGTPAEHNDAGAGI